MKKIEKTIEKIRMKLLKKYYKNHFNMLKLDQNTWRRLNAAF